MTEKSLDLEEIKKKIIEECRKENFTTESYPAIHFIVDKTINEIKQRIQEAVQGLLKEIEEWKEWSIGPENEIKKISVKRLIKKYFPEEARENE